MEGPNFEPRTRYTGDGKIEYRTLDRTDGTHPRFLDVILGGTVIYKTDTDEVNFVLSDRGIKYIVRDGLLEKEDE